ncbi:putative cell survival pathways protein [Balamuthia mandrillaris]
MQGNRVVWYPDASGEEQWHFPVTEGDVATVLAEDSDYFDSTSFVITCKDGALIFLQFVLANLKPMYTHQIGVHIKYVDPAGKCTVYSNKYDKKSFSLTDDNTTIHIGGFKIIRQASENGYTIEVDDKQCKKIKGELHVASNEGGGVKFGDDGKTSFSEDRSEFSAMFYTIPRATVTGTLVVDGQEVTVDAHGFVSHFTQNMKPHRVALKWSLMKFHSDDITLNQNLLLTPKHYNKTVVSHGICVLDNKLLAVTMDNDIVYPTSEYDKDTGYNVPTSAVYTWKGKTLDGEPFSAKIELTPSNLIDKVDILGHLPWAIRMIIKAFVARPYHYQWLDKATATVTIGDKTFETEGQALHEVTFVNPE